MTNNNSKDKKLQIRNSTSEFSVFTNQNRTSTIEVWYEDESIWLNQKLIAELFDVEVNTINYHLKKTHKSPEIQEDGSIHKFRIVQQEGKRQVNRDIDFYNLDANISVGYRVNSIGATQFKQWATQVLREYAIKGYVLDKKRMENGAFLDKDYFEHLLEEIREIRLSERRFHQKTTDIYTTHVHYNTDALTPKEFFAKVQNKLHYAIHNHTVAELIVKRADSQKKHMGLTSWKNSSKGKVLKSNVSIAKNRGEARFVLYPHHANSTFANPTSRHKPYFAKACNLSPFK